MALGTLGCLMGTHDTLPELVMELWSVPVCSSAESGSVCKMIGLPS